MSEYLYTGASLLLASPRLVLLSNSSGGGGSGPSGLANISLFGQGQSNAAFANDSDGALLQMAQASAAYLGATGTAAKFSGGATDIGGAGLYCGVGGYGSFLTWGGDTTGAAAAAAYGSDGTGMIASIAAMTSGQRAATQGALLNWGETDSTFAGTGYAGSEALGYSDKPVYKAAYINNMAKVRAAFGKTAAQFPFWFMGPPYGTPSGACMVREAWYELAADPANNAVYVEQQTYDSITRGNTWNSATGVETQASPNAGHRDAADNITFYRRSALAVARSILAANSLSSSLIPSSLGAGLGPRIISAALSGGTNLLLTIQHDGGNDLVIPALSSPNGTDPSLPDQGIGFCVMNGGTNASPGSFIKANGCSRVDATHLLLTLASTPTAGAPALYYPFPGVTWPDQFVGSSGGTEISRGCAITDNFGTISVASEFDLNQIIGSGWRMNMPLRHPFTVTGSGSSTSATFGIPLS